MNAATLTSLPTEPIQDAWVDRRAHDKAKRAAEARRSIKRRPLVDPTTCDRDYNPAEMEFLLAMQEYKRAGGRNFPTWSEVLEVLKGLGYEKAVRADRALLAS